MMMMMCDVCGVEEGGCDAVADLNEFLVILLV
jgi:hypothetical protein